MCGAQPWQAMWSRLSRRLMLDINQVYSAELGFHVEGGCIDRMTPPGTLRVAD